MVDAPPVARASNVRRLERGEVKIRRFFLSMLFTNLSLVFEPSLKLQQSGQKIPRTSVRCVQGHWHIGVAFVASFLPVPERLAGRRDHCRLSAAEARTACGPASKPRSQKSCHLLERFGRAAGKNRSEFPWLKALCLKVGEVDVVNAVRDAVQCVVTRFMKIVPLTKGRNLVSHLPCCAARQRGDNRI